jgi:periplasmic protein CpxP/Spy
MKRLPLLATMVVAALVAPGTYAQDTKPTPAKPAMNMDMDKQMPQMQEKMKAMQAQMDNIRKTSDPKERQKLMQAHMQAMQENMKMMHGMGGGQPGGMMMGTKKDGMTDGDMMKRQELMEKRMDIMQIMMDQMMQRDQMMQSMPAK